MLLRRLTEQQSVIVATKNKVTALDSVVTAHTANLVTLDAAVVAATAAVEHAERRVSKALREELATASKKHTKEVAAVGAEVTAMKTAMTRMTHVLEGAGKK